MQHPLLDAAEQPSLREKKLNFAVGDTVDVHCRILEGNKERIQIFNGTIIARRGSGTRESFTVRRVVSGEGVERTFPVHSPKIAELVIKRHGHVRRAKLFYLRDRIGKAVRLRERQPKPWEAEAAEATAHKKTVKRAGKKPKKKKKAESAG
ncbi:50S ribosomal protein L19 [Stratiformator vulcanicus]|uniref:Large ribosomal subunit protein bL19 n=1 Tax=Stratiformator vulcanicus TaxID=2527980 RepID=A0A517R0J6_9PLAN|nr:50S ribosomal protein L19 [Stratiformator vulcanicus]QDT37354.1 50S ribosomal protein L19 [Stratiformator vulcanicus]